MNIDISQLSNVELDALAKAIEARKTEAEKKAKQDAYEEMLAIAEKHGVSFEDAVSLHTSKGRAPKAPAKYRNPENSAETWSGRGRKPTWVHDALNAGKSLEDFEIK